MWYLNKALREMKGVSHGNVERYSIPGWEKSQCKGPEAEVCLCVCGIVRSQCGQSQVNKGEEVVGEVRSGTKSTRLGHEEDISPLDVSPRKASI